MFRGSGAQSLGFGELSVVHPTSPAAVLSLRNLRGYPGFCLVVNSAHARALLKHMQVSSRLPPHVLRYRDFEQRCPSTQHVCSGTSWRDHTGVLSLGLCKIIRQAM